MTENDIAYMAGILDSSDCEFHDTFMQVISFNDEVLKILVHFFGGEISVNYEDDGRRGYVWTCSNSEYIETIECIKPYLRTTICEL